MQKIGRLGLLFFLVNMFMFQLPSIGQSKKYFVLTGSIVPEVKTSELGTIDILKGTVVTKYDIQKNGRFKLELDYFNEYTLTFNLPGHFSKTIIVSTDIPQDVWNKDNNFPPFTIGVQLFKEIEGIDKSFTLKPSGKIFYGTKTDNFESESYFSDVQIGEQIQTAKAQSGQVKKEVQTITKEEAQELAAKQKNFDQLVKEADVLFQKGDYQLALAKYLEAKKLFPEKAYANDRIAELQDLVKALELTQKQKAELERKYQEAIARANNLFDQKTYKPARPIYVEAMQYKPNDEYANGRILEIDRLLALLEKQKQFDDLIVQADNNYKSKNYDQAITLYNQAKLLLPEKEYPQNQINLINQEKQQLAQLEQQEKDFNLNIQNGDKLAKQKDYVQAISLYRKALGIKPDNKLATDKIAESENAIVEIETNNKYQNAIKLADQAFAGNDLEKAKMNYLEALKIKPNETYPSGKISKIDALLADKAKLQQTENEFIALVGKGDAAFDQKEYLTAKTNYTSALDLKPNAADVKSKIKNIDNILQKIAEDKKKEDDRLQALAAAQEKAYLDAIAKGNKQFEQKTYAEAKSSFQEAKKLKPAESLPDEMIARIDELVASNERALAEARQKEEANQKAIRDAKERSFTEAMTKADKAFSENDFSTAKSGYETALTIKAGDQDAKQKLGQTEAKLAELARLTLAYNSAINNANKYVADKRYQEAKEKYQEALKYLPESEYPQAQIKKLDDLLAQAEADRQKEELYASSVKEGEALFKNKEYSGARSSFVKASELKPAEPIPASRIKEIDKLLADLALAEAKNKTIEQAYQESIKRADKAFDDKEYSSSRLIYGEALSIKPNEQYPKGKITEIDKLVADLKDQQYNGAITAGDLAFKTDLLDEASSQYNLALTTRANDPYVKKQLGEIAKRRTALQEEQNRLKKLNEQYDALMADAKNNFDGKDYLKAKGKYQSASLLMPAETLPKDQIAIIEGLLKELANAEETNRLYAESIKAAQDAFRLNKLKEALNAYQKANEYKPSEPVPPARITEISAMIAQQEEAARLVAMNNEQRLAKEKADKEQYDKAIADADEAFKGKQYKDSRSLYTNALSIFPIEKYPRSQISKIDMLIAQQVKDELLARQQATKDSILNAKNAAFDLAMASAKEFEQSKQYQNAIQKYKDAISIKPDERSNIQKLIVSLEDQLRLMDKQDRLYNLSIAKADQLFAGKKWTDALTEYSNAANIKTTEDYPKKQITEIQKILSEQKASYDNAIANADKAFNDSDWQNAKAGYTEALLVKPDEAYPQKRLKETNQKINEEKLAGIKKSNESAAYNDAMAKAEKSVIDKQLTTAITQFKVAQALKPNENLPAQRIKEIEAMIEQINKDLLAQSQHDIDEKYRQSISVADNAFKDKNYPTARLSYQDALTIKPDESYPKNQIILIDQLLNKTSPVEAPVTQELPEKQTEKPVNTPLFNSTAPAKAVQGQTFVTVDRYDEAIRKADDAFGKKEYARSKFYYYNALSIKPSEKYPKDRIHEILTLINSLLSERLENEYRDLITKADEAYTQKDIAHARFYYSKATTIKATEEYPQSKLKDIQKLIDQDAQDKLNIEYNKLIELADQAMQNKNYGIARSNYNKALSLKPNEKYPKDQMKLIKEALEKPNK